MIQVQEKPKSNFQYVIYAFFLNATLIVDFYRKFTLNVAPLPFSIGTFRNILYVAMFVLVMFTVPKMVDYLKMVFLAIGFGIVTFFSWMINYEIGMESAYLDLIFMFFSRLLPAFFIGQYCVGHESEMFRAMSSLRWLAIAYILLILQHPETSEESYITISGNLLIPSMVLLFSASQGIRRVLDLVIGLAGSGVILVYGGRGSLVSVVLVVLLLILTHIQNKRNAYVTVVMLVLATVLLLVFYEGIVDWLIATYPKSRTIRLLDSGDFLWTSSRDSYYAIGLREALAHPFSMRGFFGDRLFFGEAFGSGGDLKVTLTMFSHNVLLELLLNFGLFVGGAIIIWLFRRFYIGFRNLKELDPAVKRWHLIVFGSAIVTLMVSTSYLNDYTAWLIVGSFFRLAEMQKPERKENVLCQR